MSYQKSEKYDPWQIVSTTSLQSFKAIEPKMASQLASFYKNFGDATYSDFDFLKFARTFNSPALYFVLRVIIGIVDNSKSMPQLFEEMMA